MSLSRHSLSQRELLITTLVIVLVSYIVTAYNPYEPAYTDDLGMAEPALDNSYYGDNFGPGYPSADKRYARLSYSFGRGRGNRGGRRNRYYSSRYYRSRHYRNYYKPWLNLPDRECFRQYCSTDTDCCRRYSKCDKSAKICYNCWYGYPCKTSRDCCQRYPYCNARTQICQT